MANTIPTLCGSVAGKASPLGVKIHDAGYIALGLNYKYIAIGAEKIGPVVEAAKALDFRGLGVSMPFKEEVVKYLDEVTPEVREIGACNTIVFNNGKLTGYNTDWRGGLRALEEKINALPSKATIIGSGGVARALAYGLKQRGVAVYIAARSAEKRENLVNDLKLNGETSIDGQGQFESELVINATPIAEYPEAPIDLKKHPFGKILLDVVFQKKITSLAAEATRIGWIVVPGWRMLLNQALTQFELYTGKSAPATEMEKILAEALS